AVPGGTQQTFYFSPFTFYFPPHAFRRRMNFSDLRSILQYVPQFRGRTFVIALDGAVIDSPEFSNILLDLAVLRSLNIRVVLVHGAAAQIEALGKKRNLPLSNIDGTGITDETTLEVSMDAIS